MVANNEAIAMSFGSSNNNVPYKSSTVAKMVDRARA